MVDKTEEVLPRQATWQVHYVFFARSGFTEAAQALAQEHQARLVTLDKIETDMRHWLRSQQKG